MKPILSKSVQSFIEFIGGQRSLKTIKSFNKSTNLYNYRLSSYFQYLNTEHLSEIASLPCPRTENSLDGTNIKLSKMIRSSLGLAETKTCSSCPFKATCSQAELTTKVKPTVADLTRFLYSHVCDPPKTPSLLQTLDLALDSLPNFIKNLEKFPVPLKKIDQLQEDPIPRSIPRRSPSKKIRKIPKNLQWQAKPDEVLKQAKVERRRERQKLDTEIKLMVKRTAVKVKKQRRSVKRKSLNK